MAVDTFIVFAGVYDSAADAEADYEVVKDLHTKAGLIDLDTPPQLVAGGIASFRVFAGYAGWGPGQLQAEIDEGAWYVLAAEPADVFDPAPEQLWGAVLRRSGGALALVATYPDDPSLN